MANGRWRRYLKNYMPNGSDGEEWKRKNHGVGFAYVGSRVANGKRSGNARLGRRQRKTIWGSIFGSGSARDCREDLRDAARRKWATTVVRQESESDPSTGGNGHAAGPGRKENRKSGNDDGGKNGQMGEKVSGSHEEGSGNATQVLVAIGQESQESNGSERQRGRRVWGHLKSAPSTPVEGGAGSIGSWQQGPT